MKDFTKEEKVILKRAFHELDGNLQAAIVLTAKELGFLGISTGDCIIDGFCGGFENEFYAILDVLLISFKELE